MIKLDYVDVVAGGQYGSEGKGAVAAAMARKWDYDLLIRVAGPNAGHTVIDNAGQPRALRQIPAAGIVDHTANLYIAPGSEVDLQVLDDDIQLYKAAGAPLAGRLFISPQATWLTPEHRHREAQERDRRLGEAFGRYGSTFKGIGAARADRAMRQAALMGGKLLRDTCKGWFDQEGVTIGEPPQSFMAMIEGTQGYWLGSHAGLYPYCTSSDCRAIDFLGMAGATWRHANAVVVLRSFPIRIAGKSGPMEAETTWDEVGVPPEYTTVTKKLRRVGRFEPGRTEEALQANTAGATGLNVAMTFMDYLDPNPQDQEKLAREMLGSEWAGRLRYIGNGPDSGVWV
jgi:adenylosuccinate synthase